MNFLFFGMGYSSRAAAKALRDFHGPYLPICGTTRSADKAAALGHDNIRSTLFDGTEPGPGLGEDIASATHIIHSIAPNENGDAVLNHHRADIMGSDKLKWLCYYSTVGVYGNHDGEWIDETAACDPINKRSQWRADVEEQWRLFANDKGIPLLILRLSGIYGPGRSTFDKLRSGKARRVIKPGQVFNRIHVEDIGRVTALAAEQKLSGTFNLTDDEPAPPQDLVTYAANMAGMAPPPQVPFEEADMSEMARSFYNDNKRISNARIKQALGIELLYPTYRDGLNAIHKGSS